MVGGAGGDESPGPDDDAHDHPSGPTGTGAGARSDAELIEAVRTAAPAPGAITPSDAFAELYRRHVDAARALARHLARSGVDAEDLVATAFARLLEAMRAGRGPTEAFRAYLLTSVRHLAYDRQRAERRVDLTDDLGDVVGIDPERTVVPFADPALAGLERTLAARAFATLPERWQAVLWHLEVEGDSPADIAPLFGLTANAVSALAYRAREGLRQAYLQEHLSSGSGHQDRRHRETEQRLGAYTRGGLARRDAARVEAHLAECAECRALAGELREVNSGLVRSVVAPLVLGAGLVGYLASRGSSEYLTAMWDPGTGEISSRGGATVGMGGMVGAVGALVHPAVLSTLLVTAPGGALAAATAGVVGVVGAAGVVGALTVGGHGAVAPPRADAPVHSPVDSPAHGPATRHAPTTPPAPSGPRDRPGPTPPSPLAPVPPWDAASPAGTALPRSPGPTTTRTAPPVTTTPAPPTAAPPTTAPPTTAPPTTPIPTRTTGSRTGGPPRTSGPPRSTTPRPTTPRSATPRPTTPRPTTPRTADPRSSPDRGHGPGDDRPTRPLPLLDALGRVLAEVVPPAR